MNELELLLPRKELEFAALEYKREHFDNQDYELHGSSLFDQTDSYNDWLERVKNMINLLLYFMIQFNLFRPQERGQ